MLKNLVFPSIFKHQMSLPDVVSGLLLRRVSGVQIPSGVPKALEIYEFPGLSAAISDKKTPGVRLLFTAPRRGSCYLLLKLRVAPSSGMQLRPRHAGRVWGPNCECLGEVNSPGAKVLPGGQNAWTAQHAAPSKMGPPT